jgi:hypothetical protein
MTAGLVISMKEKTFDFSAELTCADIENKIKFGGTNLFGKPTIFI